METFEITLSKRVLSKYDELIKVLEEVHKENNEYVSTIHNQPITNEVILKMRIAKENLHKLELLRMERNYWLETHPID